MKILFKQLLKYYLKYTTKLALLIHRPKIIAVAGSINKSFAKGIIKKTLLEAGYSTRSNPKNFNTEIGLPLAVLSLPSGYNSFRAWLPALLKAPLAIFKNFPDYLVLSLGTSDPGDMAFLLTIIKPNVVVITDITQRYIESFSDMNLMQKEYRQLVKKLPSSGLLIYNYDNTRTRDLCQFTKAKTLGFGFSKKSDYYIIEHKKVEKGQILNYKNPQGKEKKKEINRFGDHHLYNELIAAAIEDYVIRKQN
jgi:UDP-N-acetylmuramoyl-tripeptide--D-alanyl-D-alanine ligase